MNFEKNSPYILIYLYFCEGFSYLEQEQYDRKNSQPRVKAVHIRYIFKIVKYVPLSRLILMSDQSYDIPIHALEKITVDFLDMTS